MIFTLFTAIVFVSQVIIAFAIIFHLIKMDKEIKYWNNFLTEAKPKIKDIMVLAREISVQMTELAPAFVEKLITIRNNIIRSRIETLISMILFWSLNFKIAKKFKKSKIFKLSMKGLSLLQNVI